MFDTKVQFPHEYFIAYLTEGESGIARQLVRAQDANGRIYTRDGGKEMLYVPTEAGYAVYQVAQGGLLVEGREQNVTKRYIDEQTKPFFDLAHKADAMRIGKSRTLPDETIAQRLCSVYEIEIRAAMFTQSFRCALDKATGICLRWSMDADLNGHHVPSKDDFTCTLFASENVSSMLPMGVLR